MFRWFPSRPKAWTVDAVLQSDGRTQTIRPNLRTSLIRMSSYMYEKRQKKFTHKEGYYCTSREQKRRPDLRGTPVPFVDEWKGTQDGDRVSPTVSHEQESEDPLVRLISLSVVLFTVDDLHNCRLLKDETTFVLSFDSVHWVIFHHKRTSIWSLSHSGT